jgi:hypothetical protein
VYGALETFEHDMHLHIHSKINFLFPRAIEMENVVLDLALAMTRLILSCVFLFRVCFFLDAARRWNRWR